jgi:hypothetical protein
MTPDSPNKISPQFATVLDHMSANSKVRAILILNVFPEGARPVGRTASRDRGGIAANVRQAAQSALLVIDRILNRFQGKRLAEGADALGSVPVEATRAGIEALATSKYVRAILEDQPISLP